MTDTTDDRQAFAWEQKGKPHPEDLFADLTMIEGLEYLRHLVLTAVGPFVELVDDPGETPERIVAEAAIVSGSLMAGQESIQTSVDNLQRLLDELAPSLPKGEMPGESEEPGPDDPVHGEEAEEPNHGDTTPAGTPGEGEGPDAVADDRSA